MKMYLIRCSCEYSQIVEALEAAEAIEKAHELPATEWQSAAWSADEAELLDSATSAPQPAEKE